MLRIPVNIDRTAFVYLYIYLLIIFSKVRWIKAFLTLPDWNSSSIGRCFQQVCSLIFPFHNNQQQMSQRREVKEERFGFTRKHTEKAASWEAQLRAQWAHIQVLFFCFLSHNSLLFVILGFFYMRDRRDVWMFDFSCGTFEWSSASFEMYMILSKLLINIFKHSHI